MIVQLTKRTLKWEIVLPFPISKIITKSFFISTLPTERHSLSITSWAICRTHWHYLRISLAEKVGRLAGGTKAIIQSDNLYLPRFTPNGVPIYDSIKNGGLVRLIKSSEIAWPLLFVTLAHYPFLMALMASLAYFGFYRVHAPIILEFLHKIG